MAQDWHDVSREHFPGEDFVNARELYRHAARLVVDHVFIVSIGFNPLPAGFSLDKAGELFPAPDEAIAAAKAKLADAAAGTAIIADERSDSSGALQLLLAELEAQRELADAIADLGVGSEEGSSSPTHPHTETEGSH